MKFRSRMYLGIGIKSIKLTESLTDILKKKQLYFRKLSTQCYEAVHCLHHIKGLNQLYDVRSMHLFPNHSMLVALERHFGTPTSHSLDDSKQLTQLDVMSKPKVEYKQKTVDIPYIKLNSWALLQKMKPR